MKWLLMIPVILFAGLAGLFAAGMFLGQGDELPSALIGAPAPETQVDPIDGLRPLTDDMLRDGEVKIVNFWASWCAPCRVEHPNLTALAEEGVPVYGVNYKDLDANARAFLDDLGDPYRAVGADPRGLQAIDWGVYGVPETFLLDGDGTILLRMAAPVTQRELANRLRPALDAALEAK
ncbi:DsbE family thiol:disulfide interchange protein [Thalassorhabdomicrobium marinisediminis]|uniref:DsbE family thiol:disulfide interchange protein n=1 Tax=Thalassorhabdomicrobium marinisediminis TaxID=2170577 RepID=A0A2T7G0T4_9RHOB|nr:DsbE family thiol:disulfide interchange protein [Thalassorhabdomicrobium marinisediminis]PVA08020.1 DsbE family thiol:disulfide interchange protein [Thalassorhabdomicrobium marinisediminis]